jgi:N-acetylglucosamine kinase-like BadF-type ATPase
MSNILAKAEAKVKVKVEALQWIRWWWWFGPNNDCSGGCSGGGFSKDGAVGFVGTGGFGMTW